MRGKGSTTSRSSPSRSGGVDSLCTGVTGKGERGCAASVELAGCNSDIHFLISRRVIRPNSWMPQGRNSSPILFVWWPHQVPIPFPCLPIPSHPIPFIMYPRIQSSKICFAMNSAPKLVLILGKEKTRPVSRAGERQFLPRRQKHNSILSYSSSVEFLKSTKTRLQTPYRH